MKSFIVSLGVMAGVLSLSGGTAEAQYPTRVPYGYTTPTVGYPGIGYRYVSPYRPGYNTRRAYAPVYPAQRVYGFPAQQPIVSGEADFIRSLYIQYLQREPDPQGMQTWLVRFAQLGGDQQRIAQEFAQASVVEVNANNPAYRLRP